MDIKRGDYRGLLYMIATAAEKEFTALQTEVLIKELSSIEWNAAYRITVIIERSSSIPKNIYGHILAMIHDEKEIKKRDFLKKEKWNPEIDCVSSEEYKLVLNLIGLISKFKDSNVKLQKFAQYIGRAIDNGTFEDALRRAIDHYDKQAKNRDNLKPVIDLE